MAMIREDDGFTQVVHFQVAPDKQAALIDAIAGEVERWVRHLPGFVSSTLHAGVDGHDVLNYAQWRTQADFEAFTRHPDGERLSAAIRAVGPESGPEAVAYHVARTIRSD